ncbi:hypothetical protein WME79_23275 [Sorangium sp. So ce726]|uniref:hypothetical protein n=1 Tax=Sorangium sp. So ce726 TaxID=3133319 RepID=UPI003F6083B7
MADWGNSMMLGPFDLCRVRRAAFTLVRAVFVVPDSQRAILDAPYQFYVFELFHRSWINKLSHFVGIPVAMMCAYSGLSLTGAAVLASVMLGMHIAIARASRLEGHIVVPLVVAHGLLFSGGVFVVAPFNGAGAELYRNPWLQVLACSVLQYLTHMLEPCVPAPLSLDGRMQPMRLWVRSLTLRRAVGVLLLSVPHVMVELISSPRNLFLLIVYAWKRCGYSLMSLSRMWDFISSELSSVRPAFSLAEFRHRFNSIQSCSDDLS